MRSLRIFQNLLKMNIKMLNKDELFMIAMKLDFESLLKFSQCSKKVYDNKDIWIRKLLDFSEYKYEKSLRESYFNYQS